MNLAQATRMLLEGLDLTPLAGSSTPPLPWRQSLALNRKEENVRPIFWKNRNRSYVQRTQEWDEFPNGRWGDSRSPAFGELDAYGIGLRGTNEQNIKLWGHPKTVRDISSLFVAYVNGELNSLPWSDQPIMPESQEIKEQLVNLNKRGFLTINSQPAVNGAKSSHPVYGWGPKKGYVYQKAYLELLVHPAIFAELISRIERNSDLTYYSVDEKGHLNTNSPDDGPNAVTWGVFPGKEIVQPTVVESISFLAWKDEAYRLGRDWASCYPATSPSRYLIESVMESWYLVNIGQLLSANFASHPRIWLTRSGHVVDNDFHTSQGIYSLFEGLEVPNLDTSLENLVNSSTKATTNGDGGVFKETNGISPSVTAAVQTSRREMAN